MQQLSFLLAYGDQGLFILRLVVGVVFLFHGLPKIKNAKAVASGLGAPAAAVIILGLVETLSALGLILGVYIQLAALLLAIVMVGAAGMKIFKWKIPFTAHNAMGWEFDLTLLAANLTILFLGSGRFQI